MTAEVLVLMRRLVVGALVLVGAAVLTFEVTAFAKPISTLPAPMAHPPITTEETCAHALAPVVSHPDRPPASHL